MGKVKSAIVLTLMTLLIAALTIVCFVPIQYGLNHMKRFDPIVVNADKDPDLGASFGAARDDFSLQQNYIGGAYTAVYYPEGVISAKEFDDNRNGISDEAERTKYVEKYAPYPDENGAVYLEKEIAYEDGEISESFKESFEKGAELLRSRFARLREEIRVEVADGFTVRVTVPRDLASALTMFSYMGELTVAYGSDAESAETILPRRPSESVNDYVKGAHVRTGAGTAAVSVDFTKAGRKIVAEKTAGAAESSSTMFFKVGDNVVLQLSVTSRIDSGSLPISGSDFTVTAARIYSAVIDTALNGVQADMTSIVGDVTLVPALYGENAMLLLYIAVGSLIAVMFVLFIVRYRLLAFVNLYTFLLFLCVNLLCIWAIPFLSISVETVIAFLIATVILCGSNALVFESARKEVGQGKTIVAAVKSGYKKNFWHIFDAHIVLALAGFVTYFIALGALQQFAFVFALATVFSGIFTLAVNRLNWATMMAFTDRKEKFCNFRKAEVADDD